MKQQIVQSHPSIISSIFLGIIGCIGVSALIFSVTSPIHFTGHATPLLLMTLMVLAVSLQITTIFSAMLNNNGAEVSFAIWLAAVDIFGIEAVPLIAVSSSIGFATRRYLRAPCSWKQMLSMITFNLGTWSLAGMGGGIALLTITNTTTFFPVVATGWLSAAFINAQISACLTLLITSLRKPEEKFRELYRKNIWLIGQNIILGTVGGGLFALALEQLGFTGVIIFALPIGLSSLSMQVYVRNTQAQMARLNEIVGKRTAELQKAYNELTALNTQKDQFLAVLSHDMKTPLSAIRLYAQLMQRSPDIAHERRIHMLETILHSEKALTDMVMDIVEIERMQLGQLPTLTYKHYDFPRMLDEICATLRPLAEKKSLALTVVPAAAPILMYGDEARLRRVFENLLSNAVKYTPEGGRIHIWTTHDEEKIKVCLMDTGYGIPEDDLAQIFTPYHRVKENEQHAVGTGLGLAIVKGFVEMHGGSVEVMSEVGVGSQFEVTLPLHGLPVQAEQLNVDSADSKVSFPYPSVPAKRLPPNNQPSSPRPRQSV